LSGRSPALTAASYPAPLTPGEPPRTSIEHEAPSGKWKTVQPVGPSSYSATPISSPGKSNSSISPSNDVRGTRSAVSLVKRGTLVFYRASAHDVEGGMITAHALVVGRSEEVASVRAFLDDPSATGALVLEGEPGIGKTTLWRAGVDAARERGRRVLEARPAEAERELSFSALGDLLAPELDRLAALSPPRRRALEVALRLAADERAGPDARAIGLATLDLLRLLAAEQPLLIALDDAQWLDPPSRETLAYALRRLDREPVVLLAARRPGAAELAFGPSKRVVVGPISLGALKEMLQERVTATLTRPTLVRIHETSGGNPFFALELAHALEGRELRLGEPLPVPASLGELTASRVERLDAEAREVLLLVAALARPTRDVVTAAAGDRATRALDVAAAAGLIEVDGSRLRFTHPLLASVHYGSATRDDRAGVHPRRAAVVTEQSLINK
jgi:hypothetical protein